MAYGEGAENGACGAGGGTEEEPRVDVAKPGPDRNVRRGTGAATCGSGSTGGCPAITYCPFLLVTNPKLRIIRMSKGIIGGTLVSPLRLLKMPNPLARRVMYEAPHSAPFFFLAMVSM